MAKRNIIQASNVKRKTKRELRGLPPRIDNRTKAQKALSHEDCVEFAGKCLGYRMRTAQRTAAIREFTGVLNMSIGTVTTIVADARINLRARLKIGKEEHESYAVAFCEAMIADPEISERYKMKAHDQLIDLLGLGAKWKGDGGAPGDTANAILLFVKKATAQQQEINE